MQMWGERVRVGEVEANRFQRRRLKTPVFSREGYRISGFSFDEASR